MATRRETLVLKTLVSSVDRACKEYGLSDLRRTLESLVPNISDQCSGYTLSESWSQIVRARHALQICQVQRAISLLDSTLKLSIVDIGDSSGVHLEYIRALNERIRFSTLSINNDEIAVSKIRDKGFPTLKTRIESMHGDPEFIADANIYLCFETMEHLRDPTTFLHNLASLTGCEYLVLSVPYVRQSRVGLHQLRSQPGRVMKAEQRPFNAETTHIFELCPQDWNLLFRFTGWRIVDQFIFTHYPRREALSLCRYLWRRLNFDGHYAVVLEPDDSVARLYEDW
ncbi:MAG: hypothetical protein CMM60_12455 [Rhodospirillaceae bacterium]|nr:hypothetical protein [Rhodospirillaceae bacterium]